MFSTEFNKSNQLNLHYNHVFDNIYIWKGMKNMKDLGEKIKSLRLSKGMTQPQLADVVGASTYTTISKWESGANSPRGRDLVILSNYFNVSVDYLLGIKSNDISRVQDYHYVPTSISAGLPLEVDAITHVELISIPDALMGKHAGNKDIYITKINGESMNNVMQDGSLIAVKPVDLEELKNGDIVVFSDNGEYGVKRFYQQDDHLIFKPDSTDFRFTDNMFTLENADGLQIHGKVVLYIVELD